MDPDKFPLNELCDAAQPREDVIILGNNGVEETLRCSICGIPRGNAKSLPTGYANPVCGECDRLAVSESGDEPWHGWPPGERPDPESGTIPMPPDRGENPVYIAGVKCWRRYRFGGWITRRDAFDCETLEEFRSTHRIDGNWIHAFNTSQPDGLSLTEPGCRELLEERDLAEELLERAETLIEESPSKSSITEFAEQLSASDISVSDSAPDPTEAPQEFAKASRIAIDEHLRSSDLAHLCHRYYRSE